MSDILLINARILPMEGEDIPSGYVLVRAGKIAALGAMTDAPVCEGAERIDAAGGYVLPGLIDAHSHLGLYEDGIGFEGDDGNENTDPITPHLRVIDGTNPMERAFGEALAAGVTTVVISPGSANPIGGQLAAVKTYGRRIDEMIISQPAGIKFAFGENPKITYNEREETPVTRMATAALIREYLRKTQEYHDQKKRAFEDEDEDLPDFDPKLEALEPLIAGTLPAHIHAHRADDIFTALRICKEFRVRPIIIHGTEGHLVADILAAEGIPVISGPNMTDRSKPELRQLTEQSPALLTAAGVPVALSTDHPETPVKFLRLAAAVAVQAGMRDEDALRAITIGAARIVGLDARIGSIVPGKDADLVIFSGHPLDLRSRVEAVVSTGHLAYRRENT